ncbi:MAG: bile acid:sodium symporter [Tunicatimonas sp.]
MEVLDQLTLHFDQDDLIVMNFCLATVMFGVALELRVHDFRQLFKQPKKLLIGLIAQILVLPLLTFILAILIKPTDSVALGMLLVSSCPGGNLSNLLTVLAKGNGALSVSLTSLTTLLSAVTLPLNFSLWSGIYLQSYSDIQTISFALWPVISTLLSIVVLPLVIGMICARLFPDLTRFIRSPFRILSVGIFISFIVVAFSANFQLFLRYVHLLLFIVLAHNTIAYVGGYVVSTSFRLDGKDRKAIILETGIQNSGLALVIIYNFFDGWGGMAFLAGWWGIWDIFSGLLLSWRLSKVLS